MTSASMLTIMHASVFMLAFLCVCVCVSAPAHTHTVHFINFSNNTSYYNKRNAHFDVQELLLQFCTERRETWQEYGEA